MSGHSLDQAVKVTVCEFPDEQEFMERAWAALADYLVAVGPSIVILPEMPFCDWIFVGAAVDDGLWRKAVEQHDVMIARLSELAPPGRGADMGQRLSTRGRLVRAPAASNDQSIEWIVDQGFGHQLHADELATNPPL